jgi:hypothetical protein
MDLNPIPHKNTVNLHKDTHDLSRRGFIKLTALLSGGLGLWLSGCTPGEEKGVVSRTPLEVVDEWIQAVNGEDVAAFEKLHSEAVFWTNYAFPEPFSGREYIWDLHRFITGNQIEKVVAFSQDQSVCLLVNATRLNRSHCFVFNVGDDLIDRVYGYDSQAFDLARSPQYIDIY